MNAIRSPLHALAAALLIAAAPGHGIKAAPTLESVAANFAYCTVCHGANGRGNVAISAPALAGIESWYLEEQLKAYRDHRRGQDFAADAAGAEMGTVARELSDDKLTDAAQYIARFKVEPRVPAVQGDAAKGRRPYLTHCAACHGPHAEGSAPLHAPALARLNDWYIVAAFKKYQSGIRGASPDNPWSNQMHLIAQARPAEFPIDDIALYLTTTHARTRQ